MSFQGRKVVITGAAGVYGRELAEVFAAEGAKLILSDVDAAELRAGAPGGATLHPADLARDADLDALVAAACEGGPPDILVNNAGIYPFIPLMEVSAAEYDLIQAVNTRAPFRLMQGIGPAMAAAGRGSIVNVTSAAADVIRGNGVPYGMSKCALEYLTRAFAITLGEAGVRVNSVRPGFAEGSRAVVAPPGYADAIRARSPLRRIPQRGEFAAVVMFLCSETAAGVTGAVLDAGSGGSINRRDGASTNARA